jgi:hypothetical protein
MPKKTSAEVVEVPKRNPNMPPSIVEAWESYALVSRGDYQPRVCFVAPPGAGKTARVVAFAEKLGYELKPLLLATMAEEDILGLPSVQDNHTLHSLPEWASADKPVVLFLDELDKATPERQAAVLTLLTQRTIHGYKLHPETIIIGAMQPLEDRSEWLATPTGQALAERLAFVALPSDRTYLVEKYGLHRAVELPAPPAATVDGIPLAETVSNRSLEACAVAWQNNIDITGAMFVPSVAARVSEILSTGVQRRDYLADMAGEDEPIPADVLAEITPGMASDLIRKKVHAMHPQTLRALIGIALRGEPCVEFPRLLSALYDGAVAHGNQWCGDHPAEEVIGVVCDAIEEAAKYYDDAKKAEESKKAAKGKK